ncbi:hypothetical protein EGI26_12525 [Lacihabitans sp. CCS-44]|uniref:hypothetical protein n=1 Tax=Lacihabitans sp. CCS-44 TaxID=2487331 RepID=UPI0020CF5899|nr:hypothetical protein [Lacihabitans sp. CCS-44]MCP9755979.1 hypothetical protein [Lacihabitans sp. CCS-44]
MENQKLLGGIWVVENNGHMKYFLDGNIHFDIEPALLPNPNRYHEFACMGTIDMKEYLDSFITACTKSGLDTITFNLK